MIDKPTSTSAATTAFCAEKIMGPEGFLWIDGNGKITAGNGTLDAPKPNAFSLVEIDDCPGSTETCRVACYVHGLKKFAPETHALYVHNSKEMKKLLLHPWHSREWSSIMGKWISANCQGGFRWHVSGDVFSPSYAMWIVDVCKQAPNVGFWIYTRSFGFARYLTAAKNLVVNLSVDKDNYAAGRITSKRFGMRLCYLCDDGKVPADLGNGSVIFPDYSLRGGTDEGKAWFDKLSPDYKSYVCPVDYHGKAENRRCGPCDRCLKQ